MHNDPFVSLYAPRPDFSKSLFSSSPPPPFLSHIEPSLRLAFDSSPLIVLNMTGEIDGLHLQTMIVHNAAYSAAQLTMRLNNSISDCNRDIQEHREKLVHATTAAQAANKESALAKFKTSCAQAAADVASEKLSAFREEKTKWYREVEERIAHLKPILRMRPPVQASERYLSLLRRVEVTLQEYQAERTVLQTSLDTRRESLVSPTTSGKRARTGTCELEDMGFGSSSKRTKY
ncbi:hypothetical protein EIP91_009171 [Steccherinum ochraceum]|uniref:Uncharacterized protein n=1 Tax=Steccherinum ochraceum TaxID=92696 RepID=A0A4R0R1Y9_9APHY|nr:hypothetical protein EIP91_009171 [Steccherinum ochraceum]